MSEEVPSTPDQESPALENDSDQRPLSFAELLVRAREQAGLSQEAVWQKLNLNPKIVQALEQGDTKALPEPAFVKGYLRAYAKLVEVAPEPIIAAYVGEGVNDPSLQPVTPAPSASASGGLFFRLITAAIVLGVVSLSILWWVEQNKPSDTLVEGEASTNLEQATDIDTQSAITPATSDGESNAVVDEATAAIEAHTRAQSNLAEQQNEAADVEADRAAAAPIDSQVVERQTSPTENSEVVAAPETVVTTTEAAAESAPQVVKAVEPEPPQSDVVKSAVDETPASPEPIASTQSDTQTPAEERRAPGNQDVLLLSSTQESWVEVRDANGDRLMFGMLNTDKTRRLEGSAPFKVFLGNAPVVKMVINEQAVSTPKFSKTKRTARFFLEPNGRIRQ